MTIYKIYYRLHPRGNWFSACHPFENEDRLITDFKNHKADYVSGLRKAVKTLEVAVKVLEETTCTVVENRKP